MITEIVAILSGFALLVWAADRFVLGAAALATNLGVSTLVVGLTVLGFGTSAPEILVSSMAAIDGNAGLAIGNAIGSNITNISLILGVTALVMPLRVASRTLMREYPLLLAISLLSLILLLDQELGRLDGTILIVLLVAVLYLMYRIAKQGADETLAEEIIAEMPPPMKTGKALLWLAIGLAVLLIASRLLVWGAVGIAQWLGVSDLIIGLTIVAIGTSLPELAASIASALKNEADLAIGNVLGSNIFNILAVLAVPGLVAPGAIATGILTRDMPVMLALTLAIAGVAYSRRGMHEIARSDGMLLLAAFVAYQGWILWSVLGNA
ncbi:MAG: calcium/sodium antiporter [Gammaproteobacteria bacterium]|jgi:cation:H+ antiporter